MIKHQITDKQINRDKNDMRRYSLHDFNDPLSFSDSKKIYDKLQPQLFTNENTEYINYMNLDGKSLLSIAGGFDVIFDFISHGTDKVFAIDMNRKQLYIGQLKLWALERLKYKEYHDFFIDQHSPYFLNEEIFRYIIAGIENNPIKNFWEYIFTYFSRELIFKMIFFEEELQKVGTKRILKSQYTSDEKKYELVKEKIPDSSIVFLHQDLMNIPQNSFEGVSLDNIVLSNIGDFQEPNNYLRVVAKLYKRLNVDGKMMALYMIKRHLSNQHGGLQMDPPIDLFFKQLKIIGGIENMGIEHEIHMFETAHGRMYPLENKIDSALVLSKNRK